MEIIDKASPIPVYLQLAEILEKRIKDSSYKIDSKIPPEGKLSTDFKVNRNTIRHAIELLVEKGLLEKQKGVGTFVKRKTTLHPIHRLGKMTSFLDDFEMNHVNIEDRITSKDIIKANSELAEKLMIKPGEKIIRLERIRIADGTPFLLELQFYPFKDFSGLMETEIKGSMYKLLTEQFNADLHHSIQTIRAVKPTKEIAQKLEISRAIPCIMLESLAYTRNNICIEVLNSYYRGDRYVFTVEAGEYRREMSSGESY